MVSRFSILPNVRLFPGASCKNQLFHEEDRKKECEELVSDESRSSSSCTALEDGSVSSKCSFTTTDTPTASAATSMGEASDTISDRSMNFLSPNRGASPRLVHETGEDHFTHGATLLNGYDLLRFVVQQSEYNNAYFRSLLGSKSAGNVNKLSLFRITSGAGSSSSTRCSIFSRRHENDAESPEKKNADLACDASVTRILSSVSVMSASVNLPPPMCPTSPSAPLIFITGGGIYYFWKAGFISYLVRHFDLSRIVFIGTSAGALVSALACFNANIGQASRLAIQLALREGAWDRPYFLAGLLHSIARHWLDIVVPYDAAELESVRRRLVLVAYRMSRVRLEGLCQFSSRQDLIHCLLASMHIPLYANGRFVLRARGRNYIDGCFGPALLRAFGEGIPRDQILVIRCSGDNSEKAISRRECIKKVPPANLFKMMQEGYMVAQKKHEAGELSLFSSYETHPCGTFSWMDDPYFYHERLHDTALD